MQDFKNYERTIHADAEESLSKIVNKIPDYSIVLDVGCSTGMLGRYLSEQKGCIVDGIDFDRDAIEISRPKYRFTAVKNLELEILTDVFKAEAYDFIIVADVIEHLINPNNLLCELKRLIKPNGMVIFSVPNITHLAASLELLLGDFNYRKNGLLDSTHVRFYSYKNLVAKLSDFGLYLWEVDVVNKGLSETEFGSESSKIFPKRWLDTLISDRPDSLVYQWILSTKIYPQLKQIEGHPATKKNEAKHIFTAKLYWEDNVNAGYNEHKTIIGLKTSEIKNELTIDFIFVLNHGQAISNIRIDPVAEKKMIWLKSARIINKENQVLWQWTGQENSLELINAKWVNIIDKGNIFFAENDDPQWYPNIPDEVKHKIGSDTRLSLVMCDDIDFIHTTLVKNLTEREVQVQSLHHELTECELQVQSLHYELTEREVQVQSLHHKLTEREVQVQSLHHELTEREVQVKSLQHELTECESRIEIAKKTFSEVCMEKKIILNKFNPKYYLKTYPDIAKVNNPLEHYIFYGKYEGRTPVPPKFTLRNRISRIFNLYRNYRKIYPGFSGVKRLIQKSKLAYRYGGIKALRNRISEHENIRKNTSHKNYLNIHEVLVLDTVNPKSISLPTDVAVHAHIFYIDLMNELGSYLQNIPVDFKFYITTDTPEKAKQLKLYFTGMHKVRELEIRTVVNRGRDIAPMIVELGADLMKHDIVLHIHSKRSPHNVILRGWRRYLLEMLLGNTQRITTILKLFSQDPTLGILFPQAYNPIRPCMNIGGNQHKIEQLLELAGSDVRDIESLSKDFFPSSSMFWFRGKAIEPLVNIKLAVQDFDPENGQDDSTLAHAIERMFIYFAEKLGLQSQTYSTHQFDPDSGFLDFSWFQFYISNGLIQNPVVIFDHNFGGGTNVYSAQLAKLNTVNGGSLLKCIFKDNHWFVDWIKADDGMLFSTPSIEELFKMLALTGSQRVIVNSLYGYSDIFQVAKSIVILTQHLGAQLEYEAHDFHGLCPSPHLLNHMDQYCDVPENHTECSNCLIKNHAWYLKDSWADDIDKWRQPFAHLIEAANTINFFDSSAIEIYRKAFNLENTKIKVRPHKIEYFENTQKMDLSGPLHIGFLGTLTIVKGGAVVNALCEYIVNKGMQIPVTVVGSSMLPTDPLIKVLGPYSVNELPGIICSNYINVIFMSTIVPETFSYTISEAMAMGLPIVAFDIGAQGNRVKQYELGVIVPLGSSMEVILAAIQSALKKAQEFKK